MSTLLDPPAAEAVAVHSDAASRRLRATMAAVRVAFTWFGVRKSLSQEQKAQAAESFGAEGEYLSAGKKLLNTSHPAFKTVTAIRGRAISYWKGISLPYPEPGIRLVRQDDLANFTVHMTTLKDELEDAVNHLDEHFAELKASARQRLGRLFNPADYPDSLRGLFQVDWDYPSVEPPNYLRDLSPDLYRQEQSRVAARFDEAVRLAEEAFTSELGKLVSHLTERLTGVENGKPKVFRDSAVENLREFFQQFRQLNVGSNDQLDELVENAQRILRGVEPQELRDNTALRQHVASRLSAVQTLTDAMMVDRPRRNIIRARRQEQVA